MKKYAVLFFLALTISAMAQTEIAEVKPSAARRHTVATTTPHPTQTKADDYALVFIAPMDTPGTKLLCRPS